MVRQYFPRVGHIEDVVPGTIIVTDSSGAPAHIAQGHIEIWGKDQIARSDFPSQKGKFGFDTTFSYWKAGKVKFYLPA